MATYFLGIIERSPESFQKEVDQLDWSIKNKIMSTLDMLMQKGEKRGEKRGREEGLILQSLNTFFKTIKTFPNSSKSQLVEVSGLALEKVDQLLQMLPEQAADAILKHIKNSFPNINFTKTELEKLRSLILLNQDKKN